MNETLFNLTHNPIIAKTFEHSDLIVRGTIEANWIKSWNISIIFFILGILIGWNIFITYNLFKEKKQ